jgi:hypothetical protein
MSQLRSDILRKNKQIAIEKSEKIYKRNHIATPIQPHETSDSENSENSEYSEIEDDDIIQVSDEDDTHTQPIERASNFENKNESDTISSTEQWVRVIQNWIDMVGEENIDDSDSDASPSEFIAVDRTIHPADDPLAKWNLNSVFNNNLESPVFVNVMVNLDSN